jgi:divalent metal cation (Fe/Co/Zn/Cd) transporter
MKNIIINDLIILYSVNILSGFIQIVGGIVGLSLSMVANGINNLSRVFANMIGAYHIFDESNVNDKLKDLYLNSLTIGFAILSGALYIFYEVGQGQFLKPNYQLVYLLIILIIAITLLENFINKRFSRYKENFFFPNREKTKFDQTMTMMVLFSIIINQIFTLRYLEGVVAFLIACITVLLGISLMREALEGLLGKPFRDKNIILKIENILSNEQFITKVESLIITKYGNHYKVIMTILLDDDMGYEQIYDFLDNLEKKIKEEVKYINVYIEPK